MIIVKNAPKGYKREDILNKAIGIRDSLGNPTRWITLDYIGERGVVHGTPTFGFDRTTINITRNGVVVTHDPDGTAEWHIDPITGRGYTIIAHTPNNLRLLAASLGDNIWKVREHDIEEEVKGVERQLMEELKKKMIHVVDENGSPKYTVDDKPVLISAYDELMRNRKGRKKATAGIIINPRTSESNEVAEETERQQKLLAQLRKQNAELEEKLAATNTLRQQLVGEGKIQEVVYSRTDLEAIKPYKALQRMAEQEFGVTKEDCENMDKNTLIEKILEMQEAKVKAPETVE